MSASLHKPTVLVIDDSEMITSLVASCLEAAGFMVVTANGAADGIAIANIIWPAVVICDFKMPGISGLEVLDRLRGNVGTRDVPFILMTGGLDLLPIDHPNQPHDIIEKPFRPDRLADAVARAMN